MFVTQNFVSWKLDTFNFRLWKIPVKFQCAFYSSGLSFHGLKFCWMCHQLKWIKVNLLVWGSGIICTYGAALGWVGWHHTLHAHKLMASFVICHISSPKMLLSILLRGWRLNDKPMVVRSQSLARSQYCIDRDRIAYYTNDVNSTDSNQPGKLKPALGSWPGSIFCHHLVSCHVATLVNCKSKRRGWTLLRAISTLMILTECECHIWYRSMYWISERVFLL